MIARLPMGGIPPRAALERLIARHGARAVLMGMVAALLRPSRKRARREQVLQPRQLSAHMKRDLGLLSHVPAEPPRYWNHY
jgi:hypothetical protein